MSSGSDDESYIINAERKAKQNYLVEEIIDNHYDPELFTDFCSRTKTADLDSWNFDELEECVKKFKQKYRRGQTYKEVMALEGITEKTGKEEKKVEVKPEVKAETKLEKKPAILQEVAEVKKHQLGGKNAGEPDPLSIGGGGKPVKDMQSRNNEAVEDKLDICDSIYLYRCRKCEDSSLTQVSNLEFLLKDPELVEGGFLSSNYYVYTISTPALNWSCKRKYTDFIWLQEMILLNFPGHFVPPLPPISTMVLSKPEAEMLPKRVYFLRQFLYWISKSSVILSHHYTENFFRILTQADFAKYIKSQKKKNTKIENIEMCYTKSGYLNCTTSNLSEKFEALGKFVSNSEAIEKKLKKKAGEIIRNLQNIEDDFRGISKNMAELKAAHESFSQASSNKAVFESLERGFNKLAKSENNKGKSIFEHFRQHFAYRRLEKNSLKDVIKAKDLAYSEFKKAETRGKSEERLKDHYGYYNYQAYSETVRVINEEDIIHKKNFSLFGRKGAEIVSHHHCLYSELSKSLNS